MLECCSIADFYLDFDLCLREADELHGQAVVGEEQGRQGGQHGSIYVIGYTSTYHNDLWASLLRCNGNSLVSLCIHNFDEPCTIVHLEHSGRCLLTMPMRPAMMSQYLDEVMKTKGLLFRAGVVVIVSKLNGPFAREASTAMQRDRVKVQMERAAEKAGGSPGTTLEHTVVY